MRKRAIAWGVALAFVPATAHAVSELSVSNRLEDRRAVVAGTRAYSIGFGDGRFYATGWHITGEMGGIWTPPLKLADGVWFGIDDQWLAPATAFTSGRGYVRYALPATKGLLVRRTDFVPDGRRAALFGLELANAGTAARTVTVKVDAHSELLGAYPWTGSKDHPTAADNLPDKAVYKDGALAFTDKGTLPNGGAHDYAALVASTRKPAAGEVGPGFRGPQPGTVCRTERWRRPRPATTDRTARAPAASCATRSPSRRGPRRPSGSPSPAPTAGSRPPARNSPRR